MKQLNSNGDDVVKKFCLHSCNTLNEKFCTQVQWRYNRTTKVNTKTKAKTLTGRESNKQQQLTYTLACSSVQFDTLLSTRFSEVADLLEEESF